MRKPWKYNRKKPKAKGYYYYVKWCDYEIKDGKRVYVERSKILQTKAEQDHFHHLLYQKLNSDVYTPVTSLPWQEAIDKYLDHYDIDGLSPASRQQAKTSLQSFADICGEIQTKEFTNQLINHYKLTRQGQVASKHTVNKDLSRIRAFINWLKTNGYYNGEAKVSLIKAPAVLVKVLSASQIAKLLKACPDSQWQIRVLLSLTVGFRAGDIDNLRTKHIDLESMLIRIVEQKTGKLKQCPLPVVLKPVLTDFLEGAADFIFNCQNRSTLHKQWLRFRPDGITRQNLRQANKTLLQQIGSIGSIKDLLHSDLKITHQYYTDQDLILRWKINQLPVDQWLSACDFISVSSQP